MSVEKKVDETIKSSLSYYLIKGGKLIKSKAISASDDVVRDFARASQLSAILLNKFSDYHSLLKDKKVAHIMMYEKAGEKINLFKQLEDGHHLIIDCTRSQIDEAKESIEALEMKESIEAMDGKNKKGRI